MKASPIINSFTTGEWSPKLNGRVDVEQYYQSAESLLNMIVEFYGGAKKAPGTYFVAEVKDSSLDTIVKRFVFSDEQAYIIEIGNLYMRFYKDKGQIIKAASDVSDFDPTSSYTAAEDYIKVGNYLDLDCGSDKYLYVSTPYGTDTSGKTLEVEIAGGDTLAVTYTAGAIKISLANSTPAKNSADLIQTALRSSDSAIDDWYVTENAAYAAARPTAGVTLAEAALIDCDLIYYCIATVAGNGTNTSLFPPIETSYWSEQTSYEIATPYLTADIRNLQFAQTGDIIYITHPDYPQAKLSRSGHTSWTLAVIDYSAGSLRPGFMDDNVTTITITPSATTGTITLTASEAIFDETHVGSIWGISTMSDVNGWVKITVVASGGLKTTATAEVLYGGTLAGTSAYTAWREAAWSGYRGYPRAVTMHEGRLYYGYTAGQPQAVWGSTIWAYEHFYIGTGDSDSLSFKMDTIEIEVIKWLFSSAELLVGTSGGVHAFGTGSDVLAITPTNVRRKKKTSYGASLVKPFQIGSNVYYWQEYNRILREYAYSLDVDNYRANEATAFSEHISESGIVDMAYQQSPFNILWCVRADGKLAVFTRQIEQKVAGWALHETNGFYESVAVIPTSSYDEVWFVVRRTIDGVTKRYIEYMVAPEFDEQQDAFFVHSGLIQDDPKVITNIVPKIIADEMEYANDIAAQAAYVSNEAYKLVGRTLGTIIGDMTTAGLQGKAFDGVTDASYVSSEVAWKTANVQDAYIGKDWGSGVAKRVVGFKAYGSNDKGFHYIGNEDVTIKLYGSNTAPTSWDDGTLLITSTTMADTDSLVIEKYDETIITPYRYHWLHIYASSAPQDSFCAECQFFEASVQCYSESSEKEQGSYSLSCFASKISLNKTLTRTISPVIDLTGESEIKFSIRASRTGSNIKIGFHDAGGVTTEHTANIAEVDTWQTETIDISGVADGNKDAIDSIIITIVNADAENIFYIDNIYTPTDKVVITSEAHGFSDANKIRIIGVVGMTEINNRNFIVDYIDADTFALLGIDGITYSTYISGGEARKRVNSVSGLTHLEGKIVQVLVNGVAHPDRIVVSGSITLDDYYSRIAIGLGYVGRIKTNDLEASAKVVSHGKEKSISRVIVNLYKTLGARIGKEAQMDNIAFANSTLFTGFKEIIFPAGWEKKKQVIIEQLLPLPMHVLSIVPVIESN